MKIGAVVGHGQLDIVHGVLFLHHFLTVP